MTGVIVLAGKFTTAVRQFKCCMLIYSLRRRKRISPLPVMLAFMDIDTSSPCQRLSYLMRTGLPIHHLWDTLATKSTSTTLNPCFDLPERKKSYRCACNSAVKLIGESSTLRESYIHDMAYVRLSVIS